MHLIFRAFVLPLGAMAMAASAQPAPSGPPPVQDLPPSAAQPGATPGPDGVIHQWGPSEPIVQNAPAPAGDYPPCVKGRTDSCVNPDPSREADTRAAWRKGD